MAWSKIYLDVILVPLGASLSFYHVWVWYRVRTCPHRTNLGVDAAGRAVWVDAMLKENDKKNVLAVQTMRNSIMSSSVTATTCVLVCVGLLSFTSNIYSHKDYLPTPFDEAGGFTLAFKTGGAMLAFLAAFVTHMCSILFLIQVGVLVNIAPEEDCPAVITRRHVADLLGRGLLLNVIGNRLFLTSLPIALWVFGPILVVAASALMLPLFFFMDVNAGAGAKKPAAVGDERGDVADRL